MPHQARYSPHWSIKLVIMALDELIEAQSDSLAEYCVYASGKNGRCLRVHSKISLHRAQVFKDVVIGTWRLFGLML